jgi:hypothetical protein
MPASRPQLPFKTNLHEALQKLEQVIAVSHRSIFGCVKCFASCPSVQWREAEQTELALFAVMQDNRNGAGVLAGLSVSARADASTAAAAALAHGSYMRPTSFTLVSATNTLWFSLQFALMERKCSSLHFACAILCVLISESTM